MERLPAVMPRARTRGLVIERLAGETLVYDLRRHRAHCLNGTASLVWRRCDGRTTVAAAAARLERELQVSPAEGLVWSGLRQLARARLLAGPSAPIAGLSRRELVRTLGLGAAAAALLPIIESIVSPTAAEAASCVTLVECLAMTLTQCTGQPICGSTTDCCVRRGQFCRSRGCP
jgi:hypothetical protein